MSYRLNVWGLLVTSGKVRTIVPGHKGGALLERIMLGSRAYPSPLRLYECGFSHYQTNEFYSRGDDRYDRHFVADYEPFE